ncbi:MAG: ABC transporter substrate-binding protein [Oscillospiraceae bacterium]|nr:ABC transporter substrate-binding protein [Oscillospiraceae bacterium]
MKKLRAVGISILILLMYVSVYVYWNHNKIVDARTPVSSGIVKETTVVKELNMAITNLDTLDPIKSKNKIVQDISKLIYDPLLIINEKNKLKNDLLDEYAQLTSTQYLFRLKDNICWHNGDKLTSQDIKDTIEYIQKSDSSIYKKNVDNIQSIKIIDELTFKINIVKEDANFIYNLIFPIINKQENIGTGMFEIQNISKDKIILVQNPQYVQAMPVLEKININLYEDVSKVYSDFKVGKIDVIDVEGEDYLDLLGDFVYNKIEYDGAEPEKYSEIIKMYEENEPIISSYFSKKILIYSKYLYGEIAPYWYDSLYNIKTWRKIL